MKKWEANKRPKEIQLSIYFGLWKIADYWKWKNANFLESNTDKKDPYNKNYKPNKTQIDCFFSIEDNPNETYYFWIFYNYEIFCFKPKNSKIRDGKPEKCIDKHGESEDRYPKVMDAEQVLFRHPLKKHELPEIFANINSHRKYNLKTIVELSKQEKDIANYLINKEIGKNPLSIDITKEEYLNFLSPIEFETLIFLIFNHKSSLCSSYRGGTLEGFDLKVSLKDFKGLPENLSCDSIHWIQAKKMPEIEKKEKEKQKEHKDRILIYIGEGEDSDVQNRIFGKKWLTDIIDERPDIQRWIEKMTFKHEMFNFRWVSSDLMIKSTIK
ncbi:MAG: hypothetical protein O8C61_03835 [Candidatus Methanoperedens sp.]|nr:hypothetical protein [Candidatus Methanoperedens sp.]